MSKLQIIDWDTTAANNTDVGAISIQGTAPVSNFDNALREIMAEGAAAVTRHVAKAAGTYTAVKTDHNQLWRATGAATFNLTAAATLTTGWALYVKGDGGAITIDPAGAETINGAATLVIPDGSGAFIVCTGTAFFANVTAAGDTVGPSSATDNAIVRFDTTTGKIIQNSGVTIDDSNNLSTAGNLISTAGSVTVGGIATSGQVFQASGTSVIVSTTGAGNAFIRPNGYASATGQVQVASTGAVTINGTLTVTG